MVKHSLPCLVLMTLLTAVADGQVTYDLAADWSDSNNPNGAWSYNQGDNPLLERKYQWGMVPGETFWCKSATQAPAICKAVTSAGWAETDWEPGDVIFHSDSSGQEPSIVTWTAPSDGTISVSGVAWDAYHAGGRDDEWRILVNDTAYAARDSISGIGRLDPNALFETNLLGGMSLDGIAVTTGDVLKFEIESKTGYGHFVGIDMQIEFTPVTLYTLTVNTHPAWAEVTVEPNLTLYEPNSIVTLTAEDTGGAVFSHWQVYDPNHPGDANYAFPDDSNNPITILMNADREVLGVFDEPNSYVLTVNTQPAWAEVTVDPNLALYEPNSIVTLTAVDAPNAVFSHWQVHDPNHPGDANYAFPDDANNPITIIMNADREVLAVFDEPNGYVLTVNTQPAWAEVTVDPNLALYDPNTIVTLTAEDTVGAVFSHWQVYDPNHPGDANYAFPNDSNNPITIIMNADREVTAVFDEPNYVVDIETVRVGDPGNAPDTRYDPNGFGGVDYVYYIGKYEVTARQYCAFLNAVAATDPYGLYNTDMVDNPMGCAIQRSGDPNIDPNGYTYCVEPNYADRPVNYVSYWDACRFANWLNNGQGDGDTETGAYTLNGYNGTDGRDIQRNANWTWAVASEDEWYKAAYYKGGGTDAGYWDYPTQSDEVPSNVGGDDYTDPGNHANYYNSGYTLGSPYYRTNVGEFENSASAYGTFDQGGNLWEWNESIVAMGPDYAIRGWRGGSFYNGGVNGSYLHASAGGYVGPPPYEDADPGFRVVRGKTALSVLVHPHPEWGHVTIEPNLPWYEPNATVMLTAILTEEGKLWTGWSGDVEANDIYTNPLTITMDADKTITTGFKCGLGMGPFLPMMLGVVGVFAVARRRR